MENVVDRLNQLEMRTRRIEKQLWTWRIAACLLGLIAVSLGIVLPGHADGPGGNGSSTVTAPFTVKSVDGSTLFTITEFADASRKSKDTLVTYYRNNQPSALFRTTGMVYRDAADPKDSSLSVFETWLYKDQEKGPPVAHLTASTALTRAGGSIVVFSDPGVSTSTPPFAARITAKRGIGGRLALHAPDGTEVKTIDSK